MNLLIVDDQQMARKAFVRMLELTIVPKPICVQAGDGKEAIKELEKSAFDIIFLDVSMPVMDGYEACKIIRRDYPLTPIIILTQFDKESLFLHFFNLGVHSILTKNADMDEVLTVVEKSRNGEKHFSSKIEELIQKEKAKYDLPSLDLTVQERHIIQLLKEGQTSKEIAQILNLTVNTVNTYRDRILTKTNTSNVAQLIAFGFQIGILR